MPAHMPAQRNNIYYDTEFLEDGRTIDLISIGLVTTPGREYYAVSAESDAAAVKAHPWLREHVWPHLPLTPDGEHLRYDHPDVKPRDVIAAEVAEFVLAVPDRRRLCAWYGAYDHVGLCQLYGRMVDLPRGFPMWTYDLKARADELDIDEIPPQSGTEHNALADAHHNRYIDAVLGLTTREL